MGDGRGIERWRMTQELPNESDVYMMYVRYRGKVCIDKNMEMRRPRQVERGSRKPVVNQDAKSLSPGMGQGCIELSPTRGLVMYFAVSL